MTVTAAPPTITTRPVTAAHLWARPVCPGAAVVPVRAISGETRVALRAGRRTDTRVTSVPAATAASREAGGTVRLSALRCGTAPERMRTAAPAAPAAVPTAEPIRPVTRPVRRTARRTWRLLAPTQRSRPITRF